MQLFLVMKVNVFMKGIAFPGKRKPTRAVKKTQFCFKTLKFIPEKLPIFTIFQPVRLREYQ